MEVSGSPAGSGTADAGEQRHYGSHAGHPAGSRLARHRDFPAVREPAVHPGLSRAGEPPGDDADPEETAAFLRSILEATAMDITAAFQAKQAWPWTSDC